MKKTPLLITLPTVVALWHPSKNKHLPKDVTTGSKQIVWWKCPEGDDHEWEARIDSVVSSNEKGFSGCSICKGLKVVNSNCLATTHPHLLSVWHPTKNTDCLPTTVTAKGHKKIWWKCPEGDDHEWEAPAYNIARLVNTTGCPICSGKKAIDSNCLATTHPDLTPEWDCEKNHSLTPYDITAGSGKKVHWKCNNGPDHKWIASIGDRVRKRQKGQGKCPYCQGQKVSITNCLATLNPNVSKEWDFEANPNTPFDVTIGSGQNVFWICGTDPTHKWSASVNSRTTREKPTGCPYCVGKKVSPTNSLAACNPEVAKEWDYETNSLTPDDVTAGSGRKVGWICSNDSTHKWITSINDRVLGTGCPYCRGQKVDISNCLATVRPDLAKEWDVEANSKTPYDVTAGSNDKIVWRCQKDASHVWESTVKNRVKGRGCSYCNLGWTVENIRHFVESLIDHIDQLSPAGLYVLFQKNGLFEIDDTSKGKSFVQALMTGQFPKDELKKFIEGSPSLVDQFLTNPERTLEKSIEADLQSPTNCLSENKLTLSDDLPLIETKDILATFESKLFSSLDREAIDFFIKEAVSRIWQHAFSNEFEATQQLKQYSGEGEYSQMVKQ